jgi:hypothetical protein
MILVDEPYYNEPSNESQRGSAIGRRRSAEENQRLRVCRLSSIVNCQL